ncbi:MAG: hypothetical protein LBF81_06375 [Prevotellaceae bacterium]|nr:hypothetical protein [Prevotellaceae bacterium]
MTYDLRLTTYDLRLTTYDLRLMKCRYPVDAEYPVIGIARAPVTAYLCIRIEPF